MAVGEKKARAVTGVRAIKTTYRGVLFMSTLEADWAKTLDMWTLPWSYEPEGVTLPDGQHYRPDFYLPSITTWLEVKGPHNERIGKPHELAGACLHAPGCGPRFAGMKGPGDCPGCGFGENFPYRLVVVGRPNSAGKTVWEAGKLTQHAVIVDCRVCGCRGFAAGLPVCRRCWHESAGSPAWQSGSLKFAKIDPPRGGRRRRT